jgi:pyruvate/2-oxoglutarate dehydrogenase complex dihydrolipoamide dehydrogenase (E3) component
VSDTYNLVVIGGGSAGLVSSYIASAVKAKVALIERHKMGGDCLNTGCVPSKALIRTARFLADMKNHREFGVEKVSYELDFAQVMERVQRVIKQIEPHDSIDRYSKLGVECLTGDAEIIDSTHVKIGERVLATKNIVLAMGAEPLIPPIKGLDQISFLTSDNLWDLRVLPKRLVVLGGGPIGCEMTQAFARLGSHVTQVEMGPRILPREDTDVAAEIHGKFIKDGVTILTGVKATEVQTDRSGEKFLILQKDGQISSRLPFDELLIAVGRKPRTSGINWDKLGIQLRPNGSIAVDSYMRANNSNIFAAGDITGPYQFTHVAAHQAWYCSVNALFRPLKKFKVDYRVIPWVTYTDPEVAQVGHNEQSATAAGLLYDVTTYGLDDLDRAIAESADHGFIKVITQKGKDKILGATVVGHFAGELITEFVAAMKHGYGLNAILGTIHSYPTLSEANKYAAGNWKREHTPAWAFKWLKRYHALRR